MDNARLFPSGPVRGDGIRSEAAFPWPSLPAAVCLQASHVLSLSLSSAKGAGTF